jgi:hypothetical protein
MPCEIKNYIFTKKLNLFNCSKYCLINWMILQQYQFLIVSVSIPYWMDRNQKHITLDFSLSILHPTPSNLHPASFIFQSYSRGSSLTWKKPFLFFSYFHVVFQIKIFVVKNITANLFNILFRFLSIKIFTKIQLTQLS